MGCLVIGGGLIGGGLVGWMVARVLSAALGWGDGGAILLTWAIGPFFAIAGMCGIASGGRSWWPK